MILGTVIYIAIVTVTIGLYSLLLLHVFAGRAYRNGYRAGICDAEVLSAPTNVRLLTSPRRGSV